MHFKIKELSIKEVVLFSEILKRYSCEALLFNDKYKIDAKSILGILSALEQKALNLEINELEPELYEKFTNDLLPFLEVKKD